MEFVQQRRSHSPFVEEIISSAMLDSEPMELASGEVDEVEEHIMIEDEPVAATRIEGSSKRLPSMQPKSSHPPAKTSRGKPLLSQLAIQPRSASKALSTNASPERRRTISSQMAMLPSSPLSSSFSSQSHPVEKHAALAQISSAGALARRQRYDSHESGSPQDDIMNSHLRALSRASGIADEVEEDEDAFGTPASSYRRAFASSFAATTSPRCSDSGAGDAEASRRGTLQSISDGFAAIVAEAESRAESLAESRGESRGESRHGTPPISVLLLAGPLVLGPDEARSASRAADGSSRGSDSGADPELERIVRGAQTQAGAQPEPESPESESPESEAPEAQAPPRTQAEARTAVREREEEPEGSQPEAARPLPALSLSCGGGGGSGDGGGAGALQGSPGLGHPREGPSPRPYMEDRCVAAHCALAGSSADGSAEQDADADSSGLRRGLHYAALFDGHNGRHAAELAAARMCEVIGAQLAKRAAATVAAAAAAAGSGGSGGGGGCAAEGMAGVLFGAFCELNGELRERGDAMQREAEAGQLAQPSSVGGTTAVVCVLGSALVHVATVGDSRAVLGRGGRALRLSTDHKPRLPAEEERIVETGGFVNRGRLHGILSVSRSLGDFEFAPFVLHEPNVLTFRRSAEDRCLLLASDGLWDVISDEEAIEMALRIGAGPSGDPTAAGQFLVDEALRRGSRDNVSALCVFWPEADVRGS